MKELELFVSTNDVSSQAKYFDKKSELEKMYDYITEGIIIRSRTVWYEQGERNSKYFLNLQKRQKGKTQVRQLLSKEVELTNSKDILKEIENHFSQKFKNKSNHTERECLDFLQDINLPKLDDEEASLMGRKVSTGEVLEVLHSMTSGKTPGNDGLSKEFFLAFFNIINEDLINSYNASFDNGQLTSSQRKAVITLIQKPDKDSRKLNGWRPISLMNVDQGSYTSAAAEFHDFSMIFHDIHWRIP